MAQRKLVPPTISVPPRTYDVQYIADLARALIVLIDQVNTAGELRATKAVFTNLPTSASGLEPGSLWNDSGTVKIVT